MKALSIKQPWAWLIVNGYKDIENRTWKTKFRGEFLVHAGKQIDKIAYDFYSEVILELPDPKAIELGGIVGKAEIVDVVSESKSKWFQGPIGFVLKNADKTRFVPYKGQLNFFNTNIVSINRSFCETE